MNETWDLNMPPLPERSHLYHLKPIGIDTPYVESLTSYVIRLAEAHCVIPKALVINEVWPLIIQLDALEGPVIHTYNAWQRRGETLNGMSVLARNGVCALEKLTMRDNLHTLTMLTWANVLSDYRLLRGTQAWCPHCYEEWRRSSNVIYSPLLWSLKAVKMCLFHQQILQEHCPSPQCQKKLPTFAANIRSGYCPYCNCWLGSATVTDSSYAEPMTKEETEQAYWNVVVLGDLLEIAPHLSSPLQKEDLVLTIKTLINLASTQKVASLKKIFSSTLMHWKSNLNPLPIDALLQLCHLLAISPLDLFFEKSGNAVLTISRSENKISRIHLKEAQLRPNTEELRKRLEMVLDNEEEPFPTLQEVAQRLGYRSSTPLRRRFPELVQAVVVKHQKHPKPSSRQKMSSDELRQALEKVLAMEEELPPTLQEIVQHLGYRSPNPLRRRFPELVQAIITKYHKYNIYHIRMSSDELRQALEEVLAMGEEPPPSLHEVAQRLGYRTSSPLHDRFPELSQAIITRYREHNAGQRAPINSDELRRALEEVLAMGEEPPLSLREVAQRLGYRNVTPIYKRFPELARAIAAKYKKYNLDNKKHNLDRRAPMSSQELQQALEEILTAEEEPPLSLQEVARCLGYQDTTFLHRRFPELAQAIVVRYRKYYNLYNRKTPMSSEKLQPALEEILATEKNPPPSIEEVALRLGYRSAGPLRSRFPELAQAIVDKYRKYNPYNTKRSSSDLQLALEEILAAEEDPPPSIEEVALRLGYRSSVPLRSRFPELARAIIANYRKHNFSQKEPMSSQELQKALEVLYANEEEPPPSILEASQLLGYTKPSSLYRRLPQLAFTIDLKNRNSEYLQQALETLLENSGPLITQQEIARRLGCSVYKLRQYFPELNNELKRRYVQSLSLEDLQTALKRELLSDEEPRHLSEVAESLGYPVWKLERLFPDICQQIVTRRKVLRKRINELRKQKIRDEVCRVMLIIHAEQKYPSVHQVLKSIDRSCVDPPVYYLEAYVPWKETLRDLGY